MRRHADAIHPRRRARRGHPRHRPVPSRTSHHGRFERSLAGLTAFAAAVTTAEIFLEHYRASFGNKMDVEPDHRHPAGDRGRRRRGVQRRSGPRRPCRSPPLVYTANGLLGEYFHARGVARKPGGWGWPPTTCRWVRRSRRPG